MSGWIKIHRSIREWEFFKDKTMTYFWLYLLLNAEPEDTVKNGEPVERGSLFTSLSDLAKENRMSIQQVRTCLDNMQSNKQITRKTTNKGTKITICNYASYQDGQQAEQQANQHITNTQTNKQKKTPLIPPDGSLPDPHSLSPLISPQIPIKKKEKRKGVSDDTLDEKASVDFEFVLVLWNTSVKRSVPKVKAITPARKEKVRLRIKEMGGWEKAKGVLAECFKKIGESDFCNGATGKWVATFDWFFENEKNWLKVMEGNYDNRKEKSQLEVLVENNQKAHEYYERRYGYGGASPYGDSAGGGQDGPDEQ